MHALIDHLGWKLASFAIACALWYFFVGETEIAASVPAVVQYTNLPADLEITGDPPDRIYLEVRGPSSRVAPGNLAQTALTFDLKGVQTRGERSLTITEGYLNLPSGVRLLRAVPSQIHVSVDRRSSKVLPVRLQYSKTPPKAYRIASESVTPSSVRVLGPEQHLAKLEHVFTDPLDLSSEVGVTEFRVPVYLSDPQVRLLSPEPVSVRIVLEKVP